MLDRLEHRWNTSLEGRGYGGVGRSGGLRSDTGVACKWKDPRRGRKLVMNVSTLKIRASAFRSFAGRGMVTERAPSFMGINEHIPASVFQAASYLALHLIGGLHLNRSTEARCLSL